MPKQFVVVVYDISNDRRRTKLHNTLLDYGSPVQYSVFECLLDKEGLARMKEATARVIKPRVDRVRYYYLCAACVCKTEVTSGVEVLHEEPGAIVV
jgi:CRISPR-associated protein Cas2